ncbi:HAMP domain-containing protein [Pedobacter sp. HMF7647]|uniref:histidine kinase n=1 Tax=Hufsiella arboris TaxID=2695275 RepID=A0A7K1YB37_9SPHI|nr:ATP-binding protein [Hufsiella arboris]MXV51268.1 HAMP domain-containing protein [Hufsiella arboris]
MKLRTKYLLFVFILHLVALVLSYFIFEENKILFLVAEAFIVISVVISWSLYRQLIQPLKSLMTGVEAIRDRDFNIKFSPTGKYEVDQLIEVYNQMIDQLRIERTLQEQQHFFLEKLIQTSPTGIVILDYDDVVQQVNPRALEILEIDEKQLINYPVNYHQNELLTQIVTLKSGDSRTVKYKGALVYKLQKSHFIDRGFSRHFILIEDLTAEILSAEKNTYGKVIRMMAHEVNNTIGPVNSIIQSAIATNSIWNENNELLKGALHVALDRNQNLNLFIRNFADLVKLPKPNKRHLELQSLIKTVVQLMGIKAEEKNIKLVNELPESAIIISADEQQVEQAFINIVKNAIEAIEFSGTVTFSIELESRQLKITDTGTGITPAQSEYLFTPFYSTKTDGKGIGLILVREILVNHGFEFSLKTLRPGCTVFMVKFN